MTNNEVMIKAGGIELSVLDVVDTLDGVGFSVSKSGICALFRAPTHRHYMECGDQFLRIFLKGLTHHFRPAEA